MSNSDVELVSSVKAVCVADDEAALHCAVDVSSHSHVSECLSLMSSLPPQLTILCIAVADGKARRLLAVGGISTAVVLVVARTVDGRLEVGLNNVSGCPYPHQCLEGVNIQKCRRQRKTAVSHRWIGRSRLSAGNDGEQNRLNS